MTPFLSKVKHELQQAKLNGPVILASSTCKKLGRDVGSLFKDSVGPEEPPKKLSGRDVILVHEGQVGWEEALELIFRQSPKRFFVVSPQLPRAEALKLKWLADLTIVSEETYQYEVHQLGLSA